MLLREQRNRSFLSCINIRETLPSKLLPLMWMQLPAPRHHAEKIQPYSRVRISEHACNPRIRCLDLDTQFLAQLTYPLIIAFFSLLNLSTREFPIAGPDFAGGTLGKEEGAVRSLQHGGSDFDELDFRTFQQSLSNTFKIFDYHRNRHCSVRIRQFRAKKILPSVSRLLPSLLRNSMRSSRLAPRVQPCCFCGLDARQSDAASDLYPACSRYRQHSDCSDAQNVRPRAVSG